MPALIAANLENGGALTAQALIAEFQRPLMAFFIRRIKDHSQAEDLTQEVLLKIITSDRVRRIEHKDRYIFKMAANLFRDLQRRRGRRGIRSLVTIENDSTGDIDFQLVEELSPERFVLGQQMLTRAVGALDELDPRTRDIFTLFRFENMKHRDIAARYGIAQSTVEKHVMKAAMHVSTRCGSTTD